MVIRLSILLAAFLAATSNRNGLHGESPAETTLAPADRDRLLAERNRLWLEAQELSRKEQWEAAIRSARSMIELQRRHFDGRGQEVCVALEWIGTWQMKQHDHADAAVTWREVASLREGLFGKDHWQTMSARASTNLNQRLAQLDPAGLHRVESAERLMERSETLHQSGLDSEAAEQAEQALAIREELLGPDSPLTAESLGSLGWLCKEMGNYQRAAELLQRSLDIRRRTFGDRNPVVAGAVSDLANLYQAAGDYVAAQRLHQYALQVTWETFGEDHPQAATALSNLGKVYVDLHDWGKAIPYYERALEIRRRQLGEDHPSTAVSMGRLAGAYQELGDTPRAEKLFHQAIQITQQRLEPDHLDTATGINNLALLYEETKQFDKAEELYRRALKVVQARLGEEHPTTAGVLINIARTLVSAGNPREAATLADKALSIYSHTLDERHNNVVEALSVAGSAYLALDQPDRAEALLRRALGSAQHHRSMTASMQSERQQLLLVREMRFTLDLYLSVPPGDRDPTVAYSQILAWKGATFARQLRDRLERTADTAPLAAELAQVSTRLATLSLHVPDPETRTAWLKEIHQLESDKESLEQQLSFRSHDFHVQRATMAVTPEQLRGALPPGAALVDVLQYLQVTNEEQEGQTKAHYQQRLVAFVVRCDQPIARVDLGPAAPVAEAVDQWRRTRGFAGSKGSKDPATVLGELVWQRLAARVEGCDTVLISPDGALARMPLGVLPGREPGSYLIEDVALGIVPVPQMLPDLLGAFADKQLARTAGKPSLLLIGDVDYDASPGEADTASQGRVASDGVGAFAPLKSTGAEVQRLRELFKTRFAESSVLLLDKAAATEFAFRREAPRHRWLHLATHGFFAPPAVKSALAVQAETAGEPGDSRGKVHTYQAGFLSGLALSGANHPPVPNADDGILTAAEVSSIDLRNVEVAVLSGCETGLGELAGGEGALGLQRAFQVAGARTTVASLWNVPDQKTSLLMQRFYANLWTRRMPKLAALREAQLWLLRTGGKASSTAPVAKPPTRQPPYYWAAFLLSGDWR